MAFQKGVSGNPLGGQLHKGRKDKSVLEECRRYIRNKIIVYNDTRYAGPEGIVEILFGLALFSANDPVRLGATKELAERYFGKVPTEQVNKQQHTLDDLDLDMLEEDEIAALHGLIQKALKVATAEAPPKPMTEEAKLSRAEGALARSLSKKVDDGLVDDAWDDMLDEPLEED